MAYRFKLNESIDAGLRRIMVEQIDRSIALLTSNEDRAVAIHETRKAMKRARALLRIVAPGLRGDVRKRYNAQFRDIARVLASSRDNTVLAATATSLAATVEGKAKAAAETLAAEAAKAAGGAGADGEGASRKQAASHVAEAIAALKKARRAVARLKLSDRMFPVIARGLEKSYRTGRRSLRKALADGDEDDFHELRKSVQTHWRHMVLVAPAWPQMVNVRAELAKELSDLLGAEHDLSMLINRAEATVDGHHRPAGSDELVRAAKARQSEIRREVAGKAALLFAERPENLAERIETCWTAAKALKRAAAKHAPRPTGAPSGDQPVGSGHKSGPGMKSGSGKKSAAGKPGKSGKPGPQAKTLAKPNPRAKAKAKTVAKARTVASRKGGPVLRGRGGPGDRRG
ncbi:MAG: CHAD domain-containing protein [Hyphomicrobiaceae bacterium]|nr:CHAD domain-containing protein [Hyphomicrobiaceae bacterium]